MIAVGVDSSLTLSGCARVDLGVGESGQLEGVRWETWRARAPKPDIETTLTNRRRIRIMLREILALVPTSFDIAVVEGPSMGSKHTPLADERAGLRWMLIDQLLARGPVAVIAPTKRELLAVGHGFPRGTTQTVRKRTVLESIRAVVPSANVPDHNVADAVALTLAGAHRLGMPWPVAMTPKQITSHAGIAWPEDLAVA